MKVLMINVVCGIRSTGRICTDLATALEARGHEVKIAYGRENVPEQFRKYAVKIGTDMDVRIHGIRSRLFDDAGFGSKRITERFINWVQEYDPDVIHLHNIHGYYINIAVLFEYLKICGKRIIWTMHDGWAFTGHCACFDHIGCEKWKKGCKNCTNKKGYPTSYFMNQAEKHFETKKQLFSTIPNFTIVTPSQWLAGKVGQSFLAGYPVKVIHNGIDISVFKPTGSDLREKYHIVDKTVLLGVASTWGVGKGLDTFEDISYRLPSKYQIVLIGLNKKQIKKLSPNIIGISQTNNVEELAEWYTAADIFVNPTLDDNYPTVNLEAISCGTPVITYNTGGSPESAIYYGTVVEKGNREELIWAIQHIEFTKVENIDFDYSRCVQEYVSLYNSFE